MERKPEEWLSKVKATEWDSDLVSRWEDDEDLYLMEDYEWSDSGGRIVKSRDYVTLNAARYFADRVIDTIKFSDEQRTIEEGVDYEVVLDDRATPIENFMKLNMRLADERLDRAEMLPTKAATAGHFTVRGRAIRRVLIMCEGDSYVPDIQWYDPMFVKYGTSKNGLTWAAPTVTRSGEDIEEEYSYTIKGKTAEVTDLWTRTHNMVWVGNELVVQPWEHKLGYVPFVSQIVPIGGFIQTEGEYIKTVGESVYAPVRKMYPLLNKLLTILMTHTRLSIEGAYQYVTNDPEGDKMRVKKAGYPIEPGKVTVVTGSGYQLIDVPKIEAAAQFLLSQIEVNTQRATLPFIDYGQTPFELSGSAMLMIKGAGDIIYLPRMVALGNMDQHTYWMMIDQYKKGGIPTTIGETIHKYKYIDRKLDGDFSIRVKHVPNLPEKDLAKIHLAGAMKELGASVDTIFRDYLELNDPDGEVQKSLRERARNSIDALWMKDAAKGEAARGDDAAVDIIAAQLDLTYEQLMSGNVAGAKPKPERTPSAYFPQREAVKQQGAIRYANPPKEKEQVMV